MSRTNKAGRNLKEPRPPSHKLIQNFTTKAYNKYDASKHERNERPEIDKGDIIMKDFRGYPLFVDNFTTADDIPTNAGIDDWTVARLIDANKSSTFTIKIGGRLLKRKTHVEKLIRALTEQKGAFRVSGENIHISRGHRSQWPRRDPGRPAPPESLSPDDSDAGSNTNGDRPPRVDSPSVADTDLSTESEDEDDDEEGEAGALAGEGGGAGEGEEETEEGAASGEGGAADGRADEADGVVAGTTNGTVASKIASMFVLWTSLPTPSRSVALAEIRSFIFIILDSLSYSVYCNLTQT
ncbi:hypothetical protein BDR22DRAFT_894520 [Usnea florida]